MCEDKFALSFIKFLKYLCAIRRKARRLYHPDLLATISIINEQPFSDK